MFSGIVEALGSVAEVRAEPPGCRLIVRHNKIAAETAVADSISINGCCLTVVAVEGDAMAFQAGPETLARTNLGELRRAARSTWSGRCGWAAGWAVISSAAISTAPATSSSAAIMAIGPPSGFRSPGR